MENQDQNYDMAVILKLPNLPVTNALAAGWINLGNIWMFCGLLILTKKYSKNNYMV